MKKTFTHFSGISLALIILIAVTSCKNQNLIKRGDSLQTAFNKAMRLYQNENYSDAAEAFETVIQIGRGTDIGQEAQFYLAESYFNDRRYLLAASEYERFISLFPRVEKREEAQYREAYCYYQMSPRYKLDQKYTKKAIEKFQLYSSRYPNSDKMKQVSTYITEMRQKLAKKLYYAADLYMRTDQYEAAIIYYDLTIDKYPETVWAQRSLVDEISAYNTYASRSIQSKQEERYEKAVKTYEKFVQLFPNGKYRSEAENHVDEARSALADLATNSQSQSTTSTSSTNGSGKNSD